MLEISKIRAQSSEALVALSPYFIEGMLNGIRYFNQEWLRKDREIAESKGG